MALRSRIGLAALAVLALLTLSCSRQAARSAQLRGELLAGDPEAALSVLVEVGEDCDGVDCLLERGHLAYLAGDYDRVQVDLARAAVLIQENWTRSLTREAATFIVNDEMRAYDGERFERLWLHFYRALAYLAVGEEAEAAVEGRALVERMTVMAADGDDSSQYRNDPFLQYFAGLLYEADRELGDAWICYREAERLYGYEEVYAAGDPPFLGRDLIRTAGRLSFSEQQQRLRELYQGVARAAPGPGEGELVILVSEGLVPEKRGRRIDFPIFEDDDDDDRDAWRIASNSYSYRDSYSPGDIDYWVSVALPELAEGTPAPRLDWNAGSYRGELALAADLGGLARQCFAEEQGTVVVRAIARALIKYWAAEKAEEKGGEGLKFLANIIGAVTEQADTRAWSSLPERVYLARVVLPAGTQRISVQGAGAAGATVEVPEGGLAFLHLRLY